MLGSPMTFEIRLYIKNVDGLWSWDVEWLLLLLLTLELLMLFDVLLRLFDPSSESDCALVSGILEFSSTK